MFIFLLLTLFLARISDTKPEVRLNEILLATDNNANGHLQVTELKR